MGRKHVGNAAGTVQGHVSNVGDTVHGHVTNVGGHVGHAVGLKEKPPGSTEETPPKDQDGKADDANGGDEERSPEWYEIHHHVRKHVGNAAGTVQGHVSNVGDTVHGHVTHVGGHVGHAVGLKEKPPGSTA